MRILSLDKELLAYLEKRKLADKFLKQKDLFEQNLRHPGLNLELLEPKHLRLWSFRIDRKYRAIFFFHNSETSEVIDINNHYR
ncbi:MAG: hypothetical protein UX81_C0012G0009 [Parcubacteria group bacterium GW2011_GWA2_47_12]|nr:MAG: hypothetical protein UX81_C0012G0009 [Parcubacteria group bacterium GW2011_GWA2_47_12]